MTLSLDHSSSDELTAEGPLPNLLTILTCDDESGVKMALGGEIDLASAPDLERELRRVEATDAGRILLDLGHLEFIDSCGLHVLLAAHHRMQQTGQTLVLAHVPAMTRRLLHLTGLDVLLGGE